MVFIKKILFRLLGLKRYLRLMNRGFYFFYNAGFLKKN